METVLPKRKGTDTAFYIFLLGNLQLFETAQYASELSFPLCQFNPIYWVLSFNVAHSRRKSQTRSSDCDLGHGFPRVCWMKYLWFRILFSPPFSYSQSGQGTVGGDLSYYASDQMEPGLHSNSLITLRAASVKKIDGAMENCIAMLSKQKLDSRFKRSGPLPIMVFFLYFSMLKGCISNLLIQRLFFMWVISSLGLIQG